MCGPGGQERRYIVTTTPLTGKEPDKISTQVDFWQMVLEEEAATIVMLQGSSRV